MESNPNNPGGRPARDRVVIFDTTCATASNAPAPP